MFYFNFIYLFIIFLYFSFQYFWYWWLHTSIINLQIHWFYLHLISLCTSPSTAVFLLSSPERVLFTSLHFQPVPNLFVLLQHESDPNHLIAASVAFPNWPRGAAVWLCNGWLYRDGTTQLHGRHMPRQPCHVFHCRLSYAALLHFSHYCSCFYSLLSLHSPLIPTTTSITVLQEHA